MTAAFGAAFLLAGCATPPVNDGERTARDVRRSARERNEALRAEPPRVVRPQCTAHENAVRFLAEKYGETLIELGAMKHGRIVEVYASAGGATWTILITRPDGIACLVSAGENWRDVAPETPGPRA